MLVRNPYSIQTERVSQGPCRCLNIVVIPIVDPDLPRPEGTIAGYVDAGIYFTSPRPEINLTRQVWPTKPPSRE